MTGDVERLELMPAESEDLAIANEFAGNRGWQDVDGMDGVVGMQVVRSAGMGGERWSTADVIGVAVGVDDRRYRDVRRARQVQVGMEVTQGIDDDRLAGAGHQITQAAPRRADH